MSCQQTPDFPPLCTRRAWRLRLPSALDARGLLVWGQVASHLPFEPRRFWCIGDVPAGETRGDHGHRELEEFLVCLKGHCTVMLTDGVARDEVVLDAPDVGLYVPSMTWSTQHRFSRDALLLVLASEVYRPDDYIRDFDEFVRLAAASR